jgi:endonuclease/exonuclease/phosphatase family metal-dependent hydrolase
MVVSVAEPHGDVAVYSHVYARADEANVLSSEDADVVGMPNDSTSINPSTSSSYVPSSDAASAPNSHSSPLRFVSLNVWNSNPPRWLWHDARDRFRQYSLRLFRLGDVVRAVAPHIVALQEVRYDSSLGGFDAGSWDGGRGALRADAEDEGSSGDDGSLGAEEEEIVADASDKESLPRFCVRRPEPLGFGAGAAAYGESAPAAEAACAMPSVENRAATYDFKLAWAISALWHNRTAMFAETDKFKQRNAPRWAATTSAPLWSTYGASHPVEGDAPESAILRLAAAKAAEAAAVAAQQAQAAQALLDKAVAAVAAEAIAASPDAIADSTSVSIGIDGGSVAMSEGHNDERVIQLREAASSAAAASAAASAAAANASAAAPAPGRSPYSTHPPPRGAPSLCRLQRALLRSPHAQIEHLAAHLPGYQFVFAPGQLYLDRSQWLGARHRDEEGPAIFSRLPVLHADSLLLSRNASDENDGHQRICLHAVLDASELGVGIADGLKLERRLLVDVYTVHLALSEAARDRTVVEIRDFIKRSARGRLVLLAGDMNAEPHEAAMRMLLASDVLQDGAVALALRDIWLGSRHALPEPTPRDSDAAAKRYAFTFPSDDPVKRIDLVFAGLRGTRSGVTEAFAPEPLCSPAGGVQSPCVAVDEAFVVGQDATPGTEMGTGGMVSAQSPIFASDHRAVAAHIRIPL